MVFSRSSFFRCLLIACVGFLPGCGNQTGNVAPVSTTEIRWTVCDFPVPAETEPLAGIIECGYITVPENRTAPDGPNIDFHFAIARRLGENPENNAFFSFRGGPGLAGIELIHAYPTRFMALRETHDFIFVDYRGTGKSNPLRCIPEGDLESVQAYLVHFTESRLYEYCRRQIPVNVDLDQYNTNNIVDDIDSLRQALGYRKIDIHGNSYGSRVAQVYVRRHGKYVRTSILDAPEDLSSPLGSSIAPDSEKSLRSLITECQNESACSKAYPSFAQDFETIIQNIRQDPLVAEVTNPASGEMETASFSYDVVAGQLRNLLYNTQDAARLPYQIDMLTHGDSGPFLDGIVGFYRLIYGTPDEPPYVYIGLYASITCSEDNSFVDLKTALPKAEGTIMGADRLRDNKKACEIWGPNRLTLLF